MCALRCGQAECVEVLINFGDHIRYQDKMGWTPLHNVMRYSHLTMVKRLLEKAAYTEIDNFEHLSTPMTLASMNSGGSIF